MGDQGAVDLGVLLAMLLNVAQVPFADQVG